jgi:hypothetical protein
MPGQWWVLLLPLWELVLGAVEGVVGVLPLGVVVGLVELVPLAALAIAAPPPTAAPVMASTVNRVVIRCRIGASPPFYRPLAWVSDDPRARYERRRMTLRISEGAAQAPS